MKPLFLLICFFILTVSHSVVEEESEVRGSMSDAADCGLRTPDFFSVSSVPSVAKDLSEDWNKSVLVINQQMVELCDSLKARPLNVTSDARRLELYRSLRAEIKRLDGLIASLEKAEKGR